MKDVKSLLNRKDGDDERLGYGEESMTQLWDKAFAKAKGDLKFDPAEEAHLADFHSASDPLAQTEALFRDWRHPQADKFGNKLREPVQQCMSWAQKACTYVEGHASGTYAEPAKLLAGGISYLLKITHTKQAAQDVSADLNTVQATFQTITAAMQEIDTFDKYPVVTPTAKQSLVGVFIALLQFCSYVGHDLRSQKRITLFAKKLFNYQTDLTTGKCEKVEQAIKNFHKSIKIEGYNDTKEIKDGVNWLIKNTNTKMQQTAFSFDMHSMSEKGNVFDKLTKTLQSKLNLNLTVMSQMATRMDSFMPQLIDDGLLWVEKNDYFRKWLYPHGTCPLLYFKGGDGVGKTFLTAHCYQLIPSIAGRDQTLVQKETVRQQLIVTYFLFEPGMQYNQSFASVVASILFQIAAQDPKWCDAIATKPVLDSRDAKMVWDELVLKRFEKRSHSSEQLYILLDGVSEMQPKERESLLGLLYETLGERNHRIWVLLTGSHDQGELFPSDLAEKASIPEISMWNTDPLQDKIILQRMSSFTKLSHLLRFHQDLVKEVSDFIKHLSEGNLSVLDQTIEIMEQYEVKGPKSFGRFKEMIGDGEDALVRRALAKDNEPLEKAVKKVLFWCAFAKQTLTVTNLNQILALDDDARVRGLGLEPILSQCKNLLFKRQMLPPDLGPSNLDRELYWCSRPEHETENSNQKSRKTPSIGDYQYIEFRNAKVRECVKRGQFQPGLDVNAEKVNIFVTLCDVLCDHKADKPTALCQYAACHLIQHLKDIDREMVPQWQRPSTKDAKKGFKDKMSHYRDTRPAKPQEIPGRELKKVGEALGRVLTNETGVSSVFEDIIWYSSDKQIHFDIYDTDKARSTNELVRAWIEKLTERDERENLSLPTQIWTWAQALKKRPEGMLEDLAKGHIRSWVQKSTPQGAKVPYRLAYRALFNTGQYKHWSRDDDQINTRIAQDLFAWCRDSRTRFAQARLTAALLLYESDNQNDREYALSLYRHNRYLDDSMCAEKLYSLLGLAEHSVPKAGVIAVDEWRKVKEYTDEALKCWKNTDAALRPNFNLNRCKRVYMLSVQACMALGDKQLAYKRCTDALSGDFKKCRGLNYFLTILVQIYAEEEHHMEIINTVERQMVTQEANFIPTWLMSRSRQTNKDDWLRRAAVATGNVEVVIRIYDSAINYWAYQGLFHETCVMLSELAVIYRQDCHAIRMAEDIFNRILDAMIRDETLQVDSRLLSIIITERFDIYYYRFSKTKVQSLRMALCYAAADLINNVRIADVIESSAKANALITLAKMFSNMNHKRRAYEIADQAFKLCIADLDDWVDDNDMPAFRTLAKVLNWLNLRKDAGIAASLIFDRANADAVQVSDDEFQHTLSAFLYDRDAPIPAVDGWMGLKVDPSRTASAPAAHPGEPLSPQSVKSACTCHCSVDSTNESPTTAVTTPDSMPIPDETIDVDESNGCTLQCMGPCNKPKLSKWDLEAPQWYMCLDCPATDYCNDCNKSRAGLRASPDKGLWSKMCWGNHSFIEQPIKGWKGVKDGVIRVGDSSRGVRDWLTDVRERGNQEIKNYLNKINKK
ncbi:uncharacterized protein BO87DRAFT_403166 [Aspergillus neoniger CBS 115656]|uniref:Nephrocystin 3-like N-terminal domain-containing protein n=1 Tax=Aspergillus neoniger (strain CBS 115656) TaxID=1448310 RepID=A0A318ZG50_ASPNB|nr:hypothetical protein BO87DRAFT_403166 [Aspergillus neoniger CBS 115656]PYH39238.1 hypothetical protein BO87DRAFT_403166 [Aspergillus neoniger CBS 115656]